MNHNIESQKQTLTSTNQQVVDHSYAAGSVSETQKVTLLSSTRQAVGVGTIVPGNVLHGKVLPAGYTKVSIEYIQPGTVPMLTTNFDDEELCAGQITAWVTECLSSR